MKYKKILLVIRDIKKNLLPIFILAFSMFVVTNLMIFLSMSISYNLNESFENKASTNFTAIPVSIDNNNTESLINELNTIYNESAETFFHSSYLSNIFNADTIVYYAKSNSKLNNSVFYIIKNPIDKSYNFDLKYIEEDSPILEKLSENLDLSLNNQAQMYKVYQNKSSYFDNLDDYNLNKNEIIEIVDNTIVEKQKSENLVFKTLKKSLSESYLDIQNSRNKTYKSELDFIKKYIVPFFLIFILLLLTHINTFIRNIYKKMEYENMIFYSIGATNKGILVRVLLIPFISIMICFVLINYLNGFNKNNVFYTNILTCVSYMFLAIINISVKFRCVERSGGRF